jgi:hypothetical protein
MCRNIKPLFNFDPPATNEEICASALQYVRKVSGYQKPSKINETAFNEAIDDISCVHYAVAGYPGDQGASEKQRSGNSPGPKACC